MSHLRKVCGKVDLSQWFEEETDIDDLTLEVINRAFDDALLDYDAEIILPAVHGDKSDGCGNPAPADPLTVYLLVPGVDGKECVYAASFRDSLEFHIDICSEDGSSEEGLRAIGDALKELVGKIDAALVKADAIPR